MIQPEISLKYENRIFVNISMNQLSIKPSAKPSTLCCTAVVVLMALFSSSQVSAQSKTQSEQRKTKPAVQKLTGERQTDPKQQSTASKTDAYSIERSIVYAKYEEDDVELKCDVLTPPGEGPFPTILMIHGGAWMSGTKLQVRWHAISAVKKGFTVVAINYRHAPKYKWPCQIVDCRKALSWMKANSKKHKIDTEKIATWGYSAGGHLAMFLATTSDQEEGKEVPVQAVVCGGGPIDLTTFPIDFPFLNYFLGDTRRNVPKRYEQASPITHLSKGDPPMFLYHGSLDSFVPIDCSKRTLAKSKKLGVVCEFSIVDGKEHSLTFFDQASVDRGLKFLQTQMKLKVNDDATKSELPAKKKVK